jgi:feruloyl esterase
MQIRRGYAVVGTNTGHEAPTVQTDAAKFAFLQPEQLIDYAYRSVHEVTVVAKAMVERFYGRKPSYSYWVGSSGGARQALIEAQRYPEDYDGFVAASPPLHFTTLKAGYLHKQLAAAKDSATWLSEQALRLLNDAVLAACDSLDGVKDSLLTDPRRCAFSPASIRCRAGMNDRCLSAAQVAAASKIYEGLKHPRTGAAVANGMSPGSELNWTGEIDPVMPSSLGITYFRWLVFGDSTWDWRSFDFARETDWRAWLASESKYAAVFNATNPDLHAFERRGGKIVQWHGWNDQQIPALNSIDYYESVVKRHAAGRDRDAAVQTVQNFYRLFLSPGGGHGVGAFIPAYLMTALEQWVERGIAPETITRPNVGDSSATQLLCPYPKAMRYSGKGSAKDATSFVCR